MKVGSTLSDPRFVNGGSPQGTKIRNFLFTITIESIEESTRSLSRTIPNVISELNDEESNERRRPPACFTTEPIDRFASNEFTASTPVKGARTDRVLRYLDESGRDYSGNTMDLGLHGQPPPDWKKCDAWSIKYVDDLNLGQRHHMDSAISIFSTSKERKIIHADECEDVFDTVRENAARIGMRVNTNKTQLLCVASNNFTETSSYIVAQNETIESVPQLKMLGFIVDCKGGMAAHVNHIVKKLVQECGY